MATAAPRFGPRELEVVEAAVPLARELTGHYFALPDDWFDRASHEVCTAKDLRRGEILGEGKLAQIRRIYRLLPAGPEALLRCQRLCPHYRICLQDHNLLARLDRDLALPDLLTCVLTHEYVHLVRFCRILHPYWAGPERREDEERRVDRITRAILTRLGHDRLRRAAERLVAAGK
ncbi:MAG: hypothetical protein Kow0092_33450 [Deferrisomatales bacterium]